MDQKSERRLHARRPSLILHHKGVSSHLGAGGGNLPVPPPFGYRELLQSSMPGNICSQDKKEAAKHNLTSRAPSFSPGSQTNPGTFHPLLRPSLLGVLMANDDPQEPLITSKFWLWIGSSKPEEAH